MGDNDNDTRMRRQIGEARPTNHGEMGQYSKRENITNEATTMEGSLFSRGRTNPPLLHKNFSSFWKSIVQAQLRPLRH